MLARQIQPNYQPNQQPKQSPQTKKVIRTSRARITLGEKLIALMIAGLVLALSGFVVHNYVSIYSLNKQNHEIEQAITQQTQVNEGLNLQVVEARDPERLFSIAKENGFELNAENVEVVNKN
ncbi:cell division protein FtsL [Alkalicoccobacillus gibsonii]|jgi:cell division protein FtsL|uniref:Cell division protein FtsL n=1 Tax=Alkalicoccobacillus gibsonii TaxID=79881 RepID=A0ABU9VJ70_9BACI|nr:cell division protein FtsL [Alkalicoccobacillus gibsonii]MBM0065262.1 cell division protein FtsL [Alkalicoccobacillus gibsonii]